MNTPPILLVTGSLPIAYRRNIFLGIRADFGVGIRVALRDIYFLRVPVPEPTAGGIELVGQTRVIS